MSWSHHRHRAELLGDRLARTEPGTTRWWRPCSRGLDARPPWVAMLLRCCRGEVDRPVSTSRPGAHVLGLQRSSADDETDATPGLLCRPGLLLARGTVRPWASARHPRRRPGAGRRPAVARGPARQLEAVTHDWARSSSRASAASGERRGRIDMSGLQPPTPRPAGPSARQPASPPARQRAWDRGQECRGLSAGRGQSATVFNEGGSAAPRRTPQVRRWRQPRPLRGPSWPVPEHDVQARAGRRR